MPTLSAKDGFSWPSSPLCGVFRHVLGLRLLAQLKTFVPAGVNGPPLQTTIVIVEASYTGLLQNTMLAKEIHEDSCGNSGQSETPQSDSSRRLTGHPRKA